MDKTAPPSTFPESPVGLNNSKQAHTPDESDQRRQDLCTFYMAGARFSAAQEPDPLVKLLMQTAIQMGRACSASLMLVDETRGDLYVAGSENLVGQVAADTRLQIGEGLVGWVAQHREAVLSPGPLELERFPKFDLKPNLIGSSLCVPLIPLPALGMLQNVVGVLTLFRSPAQAPLGRDELELVTALCTQAASALENTRLYAQLRRRTIQLENLIEIGRSLTVSLDIDSVLTSIVQKAVQLIHCESGSLLLTDQETGELIFRIALGPAGAQLVNHRLPAGAGIAGSAVTSGKPLIVNDAKADPRHYDQVDATTSQVTRSLLCVPLISKSRTLGALEVMNKVDGTLFNQEDCDSLSTFAVQSSIALENAQLYSDLRRSFTDTVRVIANAVEARDPYTAGHSERVTQIGLELAREMGWTGDQVSALEIGALLHDIGKIGVSDVILRKPGLLTHEEYAEMQKHPVTGAQMLESVKGLASALPYVLFHQERFDGAGYPFGLADKQIPIEGRVLAVVDTLDAMTSDRPYRKALAFQAALDEIGRNRGTQFDPDIVDALMRLASSGKLESLKSNLPAPSDSNHQEVSLDARKRL